MSVAPPVGRWRAVHLRSRGAVGRDRGEPRYGRAGHSGWPLRTSKTSTEGTTAPVPGRGRNAYRHHDHTHDPRPRRRPRPAPCHRRAQTNRSPPRRLPRPHPRRPAPGDRSAEGRAAPSPAGHRRQQAVELHQDGGERPPRAPKKAKAEAEAAANNVALSVRPQLVRRPGERGWRPSAASVQGARLLPHPPVPAADLQGPPRPSNGVPWQILAAILTKSRDQLRAATSRCRAPGAVGWMQFMPATWLQYGAVERA